MAVDKYRPEDSRPHVNSDVCGKCRKKLLSGHRVSIAHIVERAGADKMNLTRQGLYLYEEFEIVHVNCNDPFLKKGISI